MIVDFVLVAVVLFFTLNGFRRGFSKTLFSFALLAVSLVITFAVHSTASDALSKTKYGIKLNEYISGQIEEGSSEFSEKTIEKLPFFDVISNSVKDTQNVLNKSITEIVVSFSMTIFIYVAVTLCVLLIRRAINAAVALPVIHTADSFLGGICGLLLGVVWMFVLYVIMGYVSVLPEMSNLRTQYNTSIITMFISDFVA